MELQETSKRIIVISHERSGTHFLMNTIAQNFGYMSHPWIDLDNTNWLPYVPGNLYKELQLMYANERTTNAIVKSHHNSMFFDKFVESLAQYYHIFYIYRNSDDVMKSCCRHFKDIYEKRGWNGGPVTETWQEFAEAEPWGACLRYQYKQYKNMRHRHEDHVEGWLNHPDKDFINYVSYEELNFNFENVVKSLSIKLDKDLFHGEIMRPSKANSIIEGSFQDHNFDKELESLTK